MTMNVMAAPPPSGASQDDLPQRVPVFPSAGEAPPSPKRTEASAGAAQTEVSASGEGRQHARQAVRREGQAALGGRAASLLSDEGEWSRVAARVAAGLVLSAIFGLAMGAREGGLSLLAHALGVALAPAAVLTFGVPAFYIVLALFDAPVTVRTLALCASRGSASLGLVLSGLAPLTALYVVSAEDPAWGAITSLGALVVAGLVALSHFHAALRGRLETLPEARRRPIVFSSLVFALFATVAAMRIWFGVLPTLGGGA